MPLTLKDRALKERGAAVRLLAMDADGVLTDGSINIDDLGHETKRFCVRDGFGLRIWREMGFHAAIITGRGGRAIECRARELQIPHLCRDASDKCAALAGVLGELGLRAEEAAFLGDDWPDLRVMAACGYPMAVGDAEEAVQRAAVYRTRRPGGHGAVRDAVEHLLEAKGLLERARAMYDPQAIMDDRG
jgi:3-deoxy-D-manno-octulosonate 8-phosphate phosphatase (KDO 8-P phosphatase)